MPSQSDPELKPPRNNGKDASPQHGTYDQIEIASNPQLLTEADCYSELGYSFPSLKKWTIIMVIFLVQTSMNFNTSLYSNAVSGISEEFNVSKQAARCGAMIFLILYAFGCKLWAPWSEELGRKPILQLSLFLVNIWQIPVGIAPNFATIMVGRALGGICTAGGSVTLGMIADLWEADDQQYTVACVVFSSVSGSVRGGISGFNLYSVASFNWHILSWYQRPGRRYWSTGLRNDDGQRGRTCTVLARKSKTVSLHKKFLPLGSGLFACSSLSQSWQPYFCSAASLTLSFLSSFNPSPSYTSNGTSALWLSVSPSSLL